MRGATDSLCAASAMAQDYRGRPPSDRGRPKRRYGCVGTTALAGREAGYPEGLGAVHERPPGADPPFAQLEGPGHLVLARELAFVVVPVPAAHDQRHRPPAAGRAPVLVELLEVDRLLHPTTLARGPEPRRVDPPQEALHRVQLDLRVEHRTERVEVALIESADELPNRIGGH